MVQTVVIKGMRQRLHHMVLANQSGEVNRAQLACENLISHKLYCRGLAPLVL